MKESTTNPGHRRLVSKQSTLLDDPTKATTTTRALLVAVVAPCKFSTINTSNIIGNALDDTDDESSLGDSNSKKKTDAKAPAKIYDAPPQETDSGRKVHPLLADKNVAASTKENIQLTHSSSLRNDNEGGEAGELEEAENDAIPLREAASRVESQEITPEEAAAVTMGKDPSSSEIHVEELLRITFQTLLDEYHLLNLPTFSRVDDKKLYKNASLNVEIQEEPTPFVRMEVMARPASLGIILERLERIGVGTNVGTVSIYKAELCRTASPYLTLPVKEEVPEADVPIVNNPVAADRGAEISDRVEAADDAQNSDSAEDAEKLQTERQIQEARAEWKNAATRLRIEQIREQIADSAALSFDFISLLTIAGILAGIGLITNNSVVLVASMLVSPIMGPVLGLTFGSRVGDWPLVITSLKNESLALLGCILIGVLLGLCVGFTDLAQETWPTNEMEIRGEYTGLLIGLAVAIPSGAGVCLSILGGNTSSLVGVAISASLLPPAVNAGICFMYAILLELDAVSPDSQKSASDLAIIGAVSFALTVLNIICIWVAGIIMFHIKEVAPTEDKSAFWDKDLKAARELNKNGKKPSPLKLGVLARGLKAALRRKQSAGAEPVEEVKLKPPPASPARFEQVSLNTAFAFKPKSHKRYSYDKDSPFWGDDLSKVEEEKSGEKSDSIRYVGLEDMAGLLGFDKEDDDDYVDPSAVANRFGHGRYL